MNTFNIVTSQDQAAFDAIFSALTDHHENVFEFVKENAIVAVKSAFQMWMNVQKSTDSFEPDDFNLDLNAVGVWIGSLGADNNDMY